MPMSRSGRGQRVASRTPASSARESGGSLPWAFSRRLRRGAGVDGPVAADRDPGGRFHRLDRRLSRRLRRRGQRAVQTPAPSCTPGWRPAARPRRTTAAGGCGSRPSCSCTRSVAPWSPARGRTCASTAVNAVVIGAIAALLMISIVMMVRARSGGRATSIDLIESLMSVIVVTAPAALVFGGERRGGRGPLVRPARRPGGAVHGVRRVLDRAAGDPLQGGPPHAVPGLALVFVGLVNAVVQTAQGTTGSRCLACRPGLHALR